MAFLPEAFEGRVLAPGSWGKPPRKRAQRKLRVPWHLGCTMLGLGGLVR